MHTFEELSKIFEEKFAVNHFPAQPETLYNAAQYILNIGGKRIRPVMCLMGNELMGDINPESYNIATALELFHNFTLIHDDIMDKAPLRRGMETVHNKFNESTALLSGDVMLVMAYDYINKTDKNYLQKVINIFNKTARQVCEGQQLDMDFEKQEIVSFDDYLKMIELKTSVLLASCMQLGALVGGAGKGNQHYLYEFGKYLGLAFQVQDDYLDAFGDPKKFGKQTGGDILSNKKTFLLIRAFEVANEKQSKELKKLLASNPENKIEKVLQLYKDCDVDKWANELKENFFTKAMLQLEEVAVLTVRKKPLETLAQFLIEREY